MWAKAVDCCTIFATCRAMQLHDWKHNQITEYTPPWKHVRKLRNTFNNLAPHMQHKEIHCKYRNTTYVTNSFWPPLRTVEKHFISATSLWSCETSVFKCIHFGGYFQKYDFFVVCSKNIFSFFITKYPNGSKCVKWVLWTRPAALQNAACSLFMRFHPCRGLRELLFVCARLLSVS